MARILGLDLGGYSVKGVLIDSSLRSVQVAHYAEVHRAEGDRLGTLKAAVRELLAAHPFAPEQVIVALPGPAVTTHQVTLPFTDPKRLEAALPFEVESQLPFDLSEAVFDYQVASAKDNKSDLLVGLVRKEELSSLLTALRELGLEPRVVTHPALVYQTLLSDPELPAAEGDVAIVDIGHERTCLAIGPRGGPVAFGRTFPGGGKDLSRALAHELQTAIPDAHAWKEQHGTVGDAISGPDAERAAGAFIRALQPIVREIRSSIKAFTSRSRSGVGQVFLCGGTARLAGIEQQLTKDLGIPVTPLPLPRQQTDSMPEPDWPIAAQAFALALRGQMSPARAPRFNFRRGEHAFKGHYDFVREKTGVLAVFGGTLLALLLASGIVRGSMLSYREGQVDAALCDVTKRVLGQCEKNYDRALNLLKGKESPAEVIPKLSAVTLLAQLSDKLPPDVPVTFDQVVIDLDRVTVRGETDNSRDIDKVTNALKTYHCFHEIKQGKVEKSKSGQKVTFNLDIDVECPEHAAPPQG